MFFKTYTKSQKELKKNIRSITKDLKVVIGAGGTGFPGWLSTDIPDFDITNPTHWEYYFKKSSISNILAEHIFEHLNFHEVKIGLTLAKQYLKPGGVCRIAVPDGNHPSQYVYDLTKPGGIEPGADDHKIFFDVEIVSRLANSLELDLNLIEYFDNKGVFHSANHDFEKGYIDRCSKNYKGRFTNSKEELDKFYNSIPSSNIEQIRQMNITYTSLFFEYIKK